MVRCRTSQLLMRAPDGSLTVMASCSCARLMAHSP